MENCAHCDKELLWHEARMAFWNKHLKKGYIKWYVIGSRDMGKRKEFPQYMGKKLCQACAYTVFLGPPETPQSTNQTNLHKTGAIEIVDFAALNNILKEKEIVMPAFNCPKCSNMIDIPENGKLLICKHCGNPIQPVDIYKIVKALTE